LIDIIAKSDGQETVKLVMHVFPGSQRNNDERNGEKVLSHGEIGSLETEEWRKAGEYVDLNGSSSQPEIRVQEGDRVVVVLVTLVNHREGTCPVHFGLHA